MSTSADATTKIDDLFCLDVDPDATPIRLEPIATGLSDEDDAQRLIALRFNGDILFCRNCEVYMDRKKTGSYCPHCHSMLSPVGSLPTHFKRKS